MMILLVLMVLQVFAVQGKKIDVDKKVEFKIDHMTTFPDGSAFIGKHQKGTIENLNEEGTLRWADGRIFVGNFKDGKGTGSGVLLFPTGLLYISHFEDGNAEGYGTVLFPDRRMYVGGLKKNEGFGAGVLFFPSGRIVYGNWKDGNLTDEVEYEIPKEMKN